eukprot:2469366-Pleurochrysis_carterae.AAC.1
MMRGATGNLPLTLVAIRDVLGEFQNREVCRNIELDKPQGRAFIAKPTSNAPRNRNAKALTERERSARGDPSRSARDLKPKAAAGAWTKDYVKCRHCGGTHWHRDCPKRRKSAAKVDGGKAHSVRAAE